MQSVRPAATQLVVRGAERERRAADDFVSFDDDVRFFAELSIEETTRALGFFERTVKGDWTFARAWLDRRLSGEKPR
jgi:hypothetical protein